MRYKQLLFIICGFTFVNGFSQEIPFPKLSSPESTFYEYLDNPQIANPEYYNGNVKQVVRTVEVYENGTSSTVMQKDFMYMNSEGKLEKTIKRFYAYGVEDFKEIKHHLKSVATFDTVIGKYSVKIVKETESDDSEYMTNINGDDYYMYDKGQLVAFANDNDSVAFAYDENNKLVTIRHMESQIYDSFDDEGNLTQWRSTFEDRVLEHIRYDKNQVVQKQMYDTYGEVYDIYNTTYTYSPSNQLTKFETVYKRYLNDTYDYSLPIDQQNYTSFPKVEMADSLQTGVFTYSKTNKLKSYAMNAGKESESYTITYDENDRMHIVEGNLQFFKKGKFNTLDVLYEYVYDEKGNPAYIRSFYYNNGEKIIDKQTTFDITYY